MSLTDSDTDSTAMAPIDTVKAVGDGTERSDASGSSDTTNSEADDNTMSMTTRYITVAVLFFVNLLNYMDRYTIAGVLDKVEDYYDIGDGSAGLLQAIFIVGYMLFSPVFGYCGDRFNRKWLMTGGILFWSLVTVAGSFVPPKLFGWFVVLRALVGVGEASYSTIAPTIISDMFVSSKRSIMLMLFYFAVPVGSGLGYIVGAGVTSLAGGDWKWALRVTPGLGVICCILITFVTKEPPRGMAENAHHVSTSGLVSDCKALLKNKSFMLNTFGFVCVAFVAGALALFAPKFIHLAYVQLGQTSSAGAVSQEFGILTASAGFLGIGIGAGLAILAKKRFPGGDALVCAFGLITSAGFLFLAILVIEYTTAGAWVLIFAGMTMVCLNWSLTADILLYTVIPTRRSTAEAMMIFIGHMLGDAGSPYLLGSFSDYLKNHKGLLEFKAMQYSLYSCSVVAMAGGGLFLFCSIFIEGDRARADAYSHGRASEEPYAVVIVPAPIDEVYDSDDDAPLITA